MSYSIIKLDAIDSTNDFLKDLGRSRMLDNFTVVCATRQTKGKGQMGAKWESESGKNITVSILIKNLITNIADIYVLNIAIALSIIAVLEQFKIDNLAIKWPNDIMAGSKKIGGILIENSIKADKNIESVVGIGLNVNQVIFYDLVKATSMALILGHEVNLDIIIAKIVTEIQFNYNNIVAHKEYDLWLLYHKNLFKINVPIAFENTRKQQFMGIIQGVTKTGKLQVLDDNDAIKLFGIKEIKMLF